MRLDIPMRGKTAANIEHEKQPPLLKKSSNCLKSTYPKNSRHGKLRREAFFYREIRYLVYRCHAISAFSLLLLPCCCHETRVKLSLFPMFFFKSPKSFWSARRGKVLIVYEFTFLCNNAYFAQNQKLNLYMGG
jgi:hypothetical protein